MDVTWDDAAAIRYDYFNKTDADFASTHVRQNLSVYLPACNGTAYRQENTTGAAGTGQPSEAGGATPDPDAGTTPSGGQTDGSVTDPGQQGDGTQEPEQPAALSVIISIRILRSRCVIPPAIPQALQAILQLPLRRSPEPMR